jgi:hypothetical protein
VRPRNRHLQIQTTQRNKQRSRSQSRQHRLPTPRTPRDPLARLSAAPPFACLAFACAAAKVCLFRRRLTGDCLSRAGSLFTLEQHWHPPCPTSVPARMTTTNMTCTLRATSCPLQNGPFGPDERSPVVTPVESEKSRHVFPHHRRLILVRCKRL